MPNYRVLRQRQSVTNPEDEARKKALQEVHQIIADQALGKMFGGMDMKSGAAPLPDMSGVMAPSYEPSAAPTPRGQIGADVPSVAPVRPPPLGGGPDAKGIADEALRQMFGGVDMRPPKPPAGRPDRKPGSPDIGFGRAVIEEPQDIDFGQAVIEEAGRQTGSPPGRLIRPALQPGFQKDPRALLEMSSTGMPPLADQMSPSDAPPRFDPGQVARDVAAQAEQRNFLDIPGAYIGITPEQQKEAAEQALLLALGGPVAEAALATRPAQAVLGAIGRTAPVQLIGRMYDKLPQTIKGAFGSIPGLADDAAEAAGQAAARVRPPTIDIGPGSQFEPIPLPGSRQPMLSAGPRPLALPQGRKDLGSAVPVGFAPKSSLTSNMRAPSAPAAPPPGSVDLPTPMEQMEADLMRSIPPEKTDAWLSAATGATPPPVSTARRGLGSAVPVGFAPKPKPPAFTADELAAAVKKSKPKRSAPLADVEPVPGEPPMRNVAKAKKPIPEAAKMKNEKLRGSMSEAEYEAAIKPRQPGQQFDRDELFKAMRAEAQKLSKEKPVKGSKLSSGGLKAKKARKVPSRIKMRARMMEPTDQLDPHPDTREMLRDFLEMHRKPEKLEDRLLQVVVDPDSPVEVKDLARQLVGNLNDPQYAGMVEDFVESL